jgi:serine/threonine protein kinase/Flp pilus assembly protein TadD
MSDNNLSRVEDIFHSVIEVSPNDRDAYLARVCDGDTTLYEEVSSLIAAFESRNGFFEQPVVDDAFRVLSKSTAQSLIDKQIGQYKIVALLGKGGMGEVYLAEDTKLGRKVALKFISAEFVGDSWARRRLFKEAQAAAQLDHPNICNVYGIEEHGEHVFIVMQYVEGETLADVIKRKALPPDQLLGLGRQIVSALREAHAHGIIHRDIKPKNIMVTLNNQAKVLDFGLAKTVQSSKPIDDSSQFSRGGLGPGTIAYMSPEQLRGEDLDYLSDIFSLGTVLFEMVAGENPFLRKSEAETIAAILADDPVIPVGLSQEAMQLASTATKCLVKNKENRIQSASEVLLLLEKPVVARTFRKRLVADAPALAIAAIVVFFLVAILIRYYPSPVRPRIAILPFANQTGDSSVDYISAGISNNLIDRLSFASGLQVLKSTAVSGYKNRQDDPARIGKDLGVDALILGRLIKEGENTVLETRLVKTSDGAEVWYNKSPIKVTDLLKLQKDLSSRIVRSLNTTFGSSSNLGRTIGQTDDPDAFRLYLLGRSSWENGKMDEAIAAFTRATELDSAYALAWSGLADSYAMQPTVAYGSVNATEAMTKAIAAARRSLEAGDGLAEPHISMGIVKMRFEWQWAESEEHLKRALELDPYRASAHVWYATLLTTTGRFDEAIRETEIAKSLDPFNPVAVMSPGRAYYRARDYDKAISYLTEVLRANPDNRGAEYVLGYAYLKTGNVKQAIATFGKIATYNKWLAAAPLGYAYAKDGDSAKARQILKEIEEQNQKTDPKEKKIPAQERAIIYMGLGDMDQAFSWLEKAYNEHFPPITALPTEPIFDDLHSDPRFDDLTRRLNLKP